MEAKAPEKKMPSTAAKAMSRCAKVDCLSEIQRSAQSAFLRMQGTVIGGPRVSRRQTRCGGDEEVRHTRVDGVKQILPLRRVADVRVDQQAVRLGVNVLHHDLEAVEAAGLWDLHLAAEALDEVLVDDAIRGREEGQHVADEEALVRGQPVVPVVDVLGQVDLLGRPERGLGFLVHLPYLERASATGFVRCGRVNGSVQTGLWTR